MHNHWSIVSSTTIPSWLHFIILIEVINCTNVIDITLTIILTSIWVHYLRIILLELLYCLNWNTTLNHSFIKWIFINTCLVFLKLLHIWWINSTRIFMLFIFSWCSISINTSLSYLSLIIWVLDILLINFKNCAYVHALIFSRGWIDFNIILYTFHSKISVLFLWIIK